jgi:hypothetical protein
LTRKHTDMNNLPGVSTGRGGRYIGTADEVITKLREDGHDVSWWEKRAKKPAPPAPEKCGYFTMYILEGEAAYTLKSDGEKYEGVRKIKPEETPCWYCAGCKARFYEKSDAMKHRGGI